MSRDLHFVRSGRLAWRPPTTPGPIDPNAAIVRPFLAARCDGDTLPIHRPVSRALQAGIAVGLVDPVIAAICGPVPFQGPFGIGHECVAEVIAVGDDVQQIRVGQTVIVPWAVSCGTCRSCDRGLTSKCETTASKQTLAAYGFGPASGDYGGMITDALTVPYADHLLVPVPNGIPPLRVAAASDNLADAWRAVVPALTDRSGGRVLILGGGAKSIGLYAAGLAVAQGAVAVDYLDDDSTRTRIAEGFGARTGPLSRARGLRGYDVAVEATSRPAGLRAALRALAPGGICTAVGYYVGSGTRIPLMQMYAADV
ncbi:MAG TPA: alcohol dehydrogenase catalytic domain-containing protein, partial [Kineosporiaceae bacterium]|nr:alcohol dehydrogenase catalytic domain-containing protein [Kineosporiaceae bacterium]